MKLQRPDSYLLVQGCTGAVDEVNGSIYRYLKEYGQGGDLPSSIIERLIKRGYLTERSVGEEREYVKRVAELYHRRSSQYLNFIIAPTFSCQMRCTYCFESHIAHKETDNSLKTMTSEHVKGAYAAIEKIKKIAEERANNKTSNKTNTKTAKGITLYGGEPLMAKNYAIVREIVEEGIKRKFIFDAITNGYELLKFEDLLGPDKIETLQITVDGPASIHDKRRFTKNGSPTFDKIVEGIQLALDKGCRVNVRTNVDVSNMGGLAELNRFYMEKGWAKNPNFNPYAFTVMSRDRKMVLPMDLLTSLNDIYAKSNETIENNVIRYDLSVRDGFNALLTSRALPSFRPYFCGSNLGTYLFGPDGNVYICWEEVGLEDGVIGTYLPELVLNDERAKGWRNRTIVTIPGCLECEYALLCGGGCGRQAKVHNGGLLTPFCHQYRETFQYLAPTIYETFLKNAQDGRTETQSSETKVCN